MENIREFQSVALEFVRSSEEENPSLEDFLAQISLVADTDNIDEQPDRVMLMTMHSAKGLEFPVVFLAGMEEGFSQLSFHRRGKGNGEESGCSMSALPAPESSLSAHSKSNAIRK